MLPSAFRLQARPSEYTLEATSAFTSRYGPMTRNLPKGDLVDRLQKFGFPSSLLSKLRGS